MTDTSIDASHCPYCRAQQRTGRLTLRFLAHRAREELIGLERGLLATFWHLLVRPRRVANAFLAADPPRYYSPFRYFLVATALSILFMPNASPFFDKVIAVMLSKQGLAPPIVARQWVEDWNWLLYIPLMVFLAVAMRLFFRARGMNLAEHLVLATYAWSQMVVVATLAFSLISGLKQMGVYGVWLLPLPFLSAGYWFWFCGSALRIRSLADWTRCVVAVPAALVMFLTSMFGLAVLAKTALPLIN